ncbi:MAG: EF-hand domain-containing protein, partial [Xanthomonadaceae bacterium]|nr:EF-hand domain-containing protein [Xanthomonadaceae bacterium]
AKQRQDEWFDRADTNKDGVLSRSEYQAAMEKRFEDMQQRRDTRRTELFTILDVNKDGRLSRDEVKDHPRLYRNFDALDVNKDGFLQMEEIIMIEPRGDGNRRGGRGR